MNNRWQLSSLYLSFEDPKLKADLLKIKSLTPKYKLLLDHLESKNQKSPTHKEDKITASKSEIQEGIEQFLGYLTEDTALLRTMSSYGFLTFKADSKSQEGLTLMNKVQEATNSLTEYVVRFKSWLPNYDLIADLATESEIIDTHLFYLKEQQESTKHMLSIREEIMIAKLRTTGSDSFETLQSKITAQLTGEIEVDGELKTRPIMTIRNLAFNADPEIRKQGYQAELKAYKKHDEISASALNSIKGEVLTLCELRGFESPLDETLYNARLSKASLNAMIETMEEYLPEFRRYLKVKAKKLGHPAPYKIPFYDIAAPVGNKTVHYTIDDAKTFIIENFADFSPELAAFAQKCFDLEWLDFEPREGKVGGAFCSNIPSIGESRVLLNFTGHFKNVLTIAHELGHAFHGDRLKSESILNTSYPMPLAETASIFCETIVRNAAMKTADEDLALVILENRLQSAMQVIVDILSRYYFETQVMETRKDHPLSVNEFNDLMMSSQLKAYGDSIDPNVLHPYMWLNKSHYYYATHNFYNFPYAFGLLFATGLYAQYLERGDAFISEYDRLLRATGKMSIESVCEIVGIDPTSKAFWRQSLELIKKDIDLFESLIQKSYPQ